MIFDYLNDNDISIYCLQILIEATKICKITKLEDKYNKIMNFIINTDQTNVNIKFIILIF